MKKKFLIVNIYNPNNENPQVELLKMLFEKLDEVPNILEHEIILGGDWNCILDRNLDSNGGNPGTKTNTLAEISKIRNKYDLVDIFRAKHPDLKRYTWRCPCPLLSRRLDYFLISNTLQDCVRMIHIRSSFMSDHSPVQLNFEPVTPLPKGAGIWKFNATFLKDEAFVTKANNLFDKVESENPNLLPKQLFELIKYEFKKFARKIAMEKSKKDKKNEAELNKKIKFLKKTPIWKNN